MPVKTGPEQNIITSPQNDTFLIQKKKKKNAGKSKMQDRIYFSFQL